jgi:(2Fe-2S) ferredoxin
MYRLYLCHGPHCTARGCARIRDALDLALWELRVAGVELLASGCQDHCDHGPNLLVQPGATRYAGLTAERARRIVAEHLAQGQPIAELEATPEMRRKPRQG